jgi:hypothetical protein
LAFGKASRFLGDARRILRRVSLRRRDGPLCFGGASRRVGEGALTAGPSSSFLGSAAFAERDAAFIGHTDACLVRQASCRFGGAFSLASRPALRLGEARLNERNACPRGDNARWRKYRASFLEAKARLPKDGARLCEDEAALREDSARLHEDDVRLRKNDARLRDAKARLRKNDARLRDANARRREGSAPPRDREASFRDHHARRLEDDDRLCEGAAPLLERKAVPARFTETRRRAGVAWPGGKRRRQRDLVLLTLSYRTNPDSL